MIKSYSENILENKKEIWYYKGWGRGYCTLFYSTEP